MKQYIRKILITASALTITSAYALTSDDALHPAAHIGGSYALTHASIATCKKVTNWSNLTCTLVGGGLAASAGIAVELSQSEGMKDHAKSYLEDGAGIGLAIFFTNF